MSFFTCCQKQNTNKTDLQQNIITWVENGIFNDISEVGVYSVSPDGAHLNVAIYEASSSPQYERNSTEERVYKRLMKVGGMTREEAKQCLVIRKIDPAPVRITLE